MNSVPVSDKEAEFGDNELFFSITQRDSTILSGNEVFVRISGYSEAELVGSYHNIIRHPDMPRIVFKTLWDALKCDRPLVAYIKNRSKEGRYYWVLAAVFPMGDHFISIRIKPDSKLFAAVPELYRALSAAEADGGMEASQTRMAELLRENGFESYERFMSEALLMELKRRKTRRSRNGEGLVASAAEGGLKGLYDVCRQLVGEYDGWFEKIDFFREVKTVFEAKALQLRRLARDVVFLSLNASVSSYQVDRGGETFAILARDVRTNAKENDAMIGMFNGFVSDVAAGLDRLVFAVSSVALQIETITYFLEEVMTRHPAETLVRVDDKIADLIGLVCTYARASFAMQEEILSHSAQILEHLERMERQMLYLGYIQVYGVIEAARDDNGTGRFGVIFSELKTFLEQTVGEVAAMQKLGNDFDRQSRALQGRAGGIETWLRQLEAGGASLKDYRGV